MECTACLVCLFSTVTVSGYSKKTTTKKCGASSRHTTKLKQSNSLDMYAFDRFIAIKHDQTDYRPRPNPS